MNDSNTICLEGMIHPLVPRPIANNFNAQKESALILGSNMSGKTTFIKTIGVNLILAQTIGICRAVKAELPRLQVKTSIRRSDALDQQKSYYYREIEAIRNFIQLGERGSNYLFLIDEIFRGTNTIERISIATAVLNFLSRSNWAMVTTHDVELQELLYPQFECYHFAEQVENGKHYFDYKIRRGQCHQRNAIALVELMGYPEEIVTKAREIAAAIQRD